MDCLFCFSGDGSSDHQRVQPLAVAGGGVPGRGAAHGRPQGRRLYAEWAGEGPNAAATAPPGRSHHPDYRQRA